jgi:hypothetical protein
MLHSKLNVLYVPLNTNVWLIHVQSLKLAESPHYETSISVPGNITPRGGNVSTVDNFNLMTKR